MPKDKFSAYHRSSHYRALAEVPAEGWTRIRDLSRSISLGYLQEIMADWAAPQGYVERRNQNEGGVRAVWAVRLTAKGTALLRDIGYTNTEDTCTD